MKHSSAWFMNGGTSKCSNDRVVAMILWESQEQQMGIVLYSAWHVPSQGRTYPIIGNLLLEQEGMHLCPVTATWLLIYFSWLYGLFIALDTNFRLKQKAMSSDEADPTLSNGWAYFVDECVYKEYLQTQMNVIQPVSVSLWICMLCLMSAIEESLLKPQCRQPSGC